MKRYAAVLLAVCACSVAAVVVPGTVAAGGSYWTNGQVPKAKLLAGWDFTSSSTPPVTANQLLWSEYFDTLASQWTKSGSTVTSFAVVDPIGGPSGTSLVESAGTGPWQVFQSASCAAPCTLSAYLQKSGRNLGYLQVNAGSVYVAWFDLNAGSVLTVNSGITATMANVGGGWYRCSITRATGTITVAAIGSAEADGSRTGTRLSASGIYMYGAQLESGSSATAYAKTVGPVAYQDLSGNKHHITVVSGTPGAGLALNGTSNYAVADPINPSGNSMTIIAAVYPTGAAPSGHNPAIVEHRASTDGYALLIPATTRKFQLGLAASTTNRSTTSSYTDNAWITISEVVGGTFDAPYLNGQMDVYYSDTQDQTIITSNTALTYVGKRSIASDYFAGTVGALLIYDRALTDAEVNALHLTLKSYLSASITLPASAVPAAVAAASNPSPRMGWTNLFTCFSHCSETDMHTGSDKLVSLGLTAAGYTLVMIDDAWEAASRDGGGNIQASATLFPSGMTALAAYVHGVGQKLGIYTSPGATTCGGFVGSYQHEAQDVNTFASWNIDHIKYDWCSATSIYGNPAPFASEVAVWNQLASAIRASSSPTMTYHQNSVGDKYLLPWYGKSGANQARTIADATGLWANTLALTFNADAAVANLYQGGASRQYAGPNHWVDRDALLCGIGGGTDGECRTQFAMYSILAAPLIIGNNLNSVTANQVAIWKNSDLIAADQDSLGIQGFRASQVSCGSATCEIWVKPLSNRGWIVGFFNLASTAQDIAATWSMFDNSGKPYSAKEVWSASQLGVLASGYTATAVPSHDCVVLRLTL